MRFEQPKELNHLVLDTIPWTWERRWRRWKVIIPIVLFCNVSLTETGLLKAWAAEKLDWDFVGVIVAANLSLLALFFLAMEYLVAFENRSKRSVDLGKRWICISPVKETRRSWETVRACHLEPIPTLQDAIKLTLEFGSKSGKASRGRSWSMVLTNCEQGKQLLAELGNQRVQRQLDFVINQHSQPRPKPPVRRFSNKCLWFLMASFWLIVHGMPLLAIGILGSQDGQDLSSQSEVEFSPEREQQLGKFLFRYFHSMDQLRRGFLIGGGALCALAVVFYVVGIRTPVTFDDGNSKPADGALPQGLPGGKE